ncbi:unnamed protein product [Gordionus sp. m RMFG-2023]|uniref:UDP-glucose 4-epimerase-like n=1 Tax=Gordionus sp. m RMFG-2023 TaxID=3053472 RepID=UPI0030DF6954
MLDILVTGGAGYIGSHTVIELLNAGYNPIIVDNFSNSVKDHNNKAESLKRVEEITGKNVTFFQVDLLNIKDLEKIFIKYSFFCVIHFSGLKSVSESKQIPLKYYTVNLGGTLNLLNTMFKFNVKNIIFSSSATVYGEPQYLPIDEKHPVGNCINAYGKSKYFIEEILRDLAESDRSWNIVILRYFNPIGAHKSGKIGEDPLDIPNNLMPYISKTAMGIFPKLNIFGNDYSTVDGTGVRDYIHVVDLAKGHVCALKTMTPKINNGSLNNSKQGKEALSHKDDKSDGVRIYNLGVGKGCSVLELMHNFEKVCGKKIPYEFQARRAGDTASCYADASLALKELNWKAGMDINEMCQDTWNWQKNNPKGFATEKI